MSQERNGGRGPQAGQPDANADPVGPTSRWGKPVTIAGAVVVGLAILWAIVASGWFF